MSLEKLLIIMADGEFHSGDELGLALGVVIPPEINRSRK
jgi:biotin operon repressor